MKLINTEIIEENGLKFKVETYDNGAIVKTAWSDEPIEPVEPIGPEHESSLEEMMLTIQVNTEYLICLNEINEE